MSLNKTYARPSSPIVEINFSQEYESQVARHILKVGKYHGTCMSELDCVASRATLRAGVYRTPRTKSPEHQSQCFIDRLI